MMEGKVMKRNVFFAQALKAAGIDLTKDFFCPAHQEQSIQLVPSHLQCYYLVHMYRS